MAAILQLGTADKVTHEIGYFCALKAIEDIETPLHEKRFFYNMAKRFDLTERQEALLSGFFDRAEAEARNGMAHGDGTVHSNRSTH